MLGTPKQLARYIREFSVEAPITEAFERACRKSCGTKPWYESQKEHWLGWLGAYDGPGAYGRMVWDRSAEFIYNHVVCPPMVLWLGEASGVADAEVKKAKRAAISAGAALAAQSAAIRRVIRDPVACHFGSSGQSTSSARNLGGLTPLPKTSPRSAISIRQPYAEQII